MLEDKECVVLGTDNDISPRTPPWGQHSTPETEGERTESCTTTYSAAHVNQFIKFIRDNYKITGYAFVILLNLLVYSFLFFFSLSFPLKYKTIYHHIVHSMECQQYNKSRRRQT